jgi:hypothetical protein
MAFSYHRTPRCHRPTTTPLRYRNPSLDNGATRVGRRERVTGDQAGETIVQEAPYKLVIFMKRRPGLTLEQFRDHYENVHVKLCERYMAGVTHYVRRYIQPLPDPVTGMVSEMEYDVVTETWFEDRAVFDAVLAAAAGDSMPADVVRDEEQLFDRAKSRFTTVVEYETPR